MTFRPDLYVLARFLERLAEPRPWTRASLQLAVRLNYTLFARYLDFLAGKGWVRIEATETPATIVLTHAGHEAWSALRTWLATWLSGSKL
ncbi:MAG TPA: hypothetical protein VM286_05200 [Candidatus Thermoplasmatota archaeon]|nr:hypothetical protein [Candidatus Thermoplasmatota archaeon]